jgi:hypothetical protein
MEGRAVQKIVEDDISNRVGLWMVAKSRPDDLFAGTFFDIREKAKKLKNKWSDEAQAHLQKTLINDLMSKKVKVLDAKLSLGQYRGSKFVTSAKLKVQIKDKASAEKLASYLQSKFSPKYKLKSFKEEEGIAEYNVR